MKIYHTKNPNNDPKIAASNMAEDFERGKGTGPGLKMIGVKACYARMAQSIHEHGDVAELRRCIYRTLAANKQQIDKCRKLMSEAELYRMAAEIINHVAVKQPDVEYGSDPRLPKGLAEHKVKSRITFAYNDGPDHFEIFGGQDCSASQISAGLVAAALVHGNLDGLICIAFLGL